VNWEVQHHFKNNILKSFGLFQSMHLILPKGLCSTKVENDIWTNEDNLSKEKQTLTNIDPPHKSRQNNSKKMTPYKLLNTLVEIMLFATNHYATSMQLTIVYNYFGHVCNCKFGII